jgi:hypothetical protein
LKQPTAQLPPASHAEAKRFLIFIKVFFGLWEAQANHEAGVMVARRDPGGMVTVPARPYVVIPAALRSRCGLRAGDNVLLAASPGEDMLTALAVGLILLCAGLLAHTGLGRRRLAAWDADWQVTEPQWTKGR